MSAIPGRSYIWRNAVLNAEPKSEISISNEEIAPYLRVERLHPILRGVVDDLDWVETVSF